MAYAPSCFGGAAVLCTVHLILYSCMHTSTTQMHMYPRALNSYFPCSQQTEMRSTLAAFKVTKCVLAPITGSECLEFLNYKNFMCLRRCVKVRNMRDRNET